VTRIALRSERCPGALPEVISNCKVSKRRGPSLCDRRDECESVCFDWLRYGTGAASLESQSLYSLCTRRPLGTQVS
jgi:hypothetical protein